MRHMNVYGTLENLHEKVAIHINDTHPTLAIPELMRILLDDCGYDWDKAWNIITNTFDYTNHTVMAEALETWDVDLMQRILPRIYAIIVEINNRYCAHLMEVTGGDSEKVTRMSIILDNRVKMANLCCAASSSVNGVSKLHSEIIKDSVFHDQYTVNPDAFKNVTNGIAYRRWLLASNQGLTNLLTECIGDGFKKDASKLAEILMPASEISEQISLAGTEASGTGNMKLMLNGALTMGTYDGANVEIHEAVGDDNIFIFGMSTPEVNQLKAEGYNPEKIYNSHAVIKSVLEKMYKGINGATFEEVANSLRHADRYMCFADFDSYRGTQAKASETYKDKYLWNKMSLINIASAGIFSADRAVTDYARDIWKLI